MSNVVDNEASINEVIPRLISSRWTVTNPIKDLRSALRSVGTPTSIYIDVPFLGSHITQRGIRYSDSYRVTKRFGVIFREKIDDLVIWKFQLDPKFADILTDEEFNLCVKCWEGAKPSEIRDLINQVYLRLKDLEPLKAVHQNEGVSKKKKDKSTYEVTYDPDKLTIYLKENFKDSLLLEDDEEIDEEEVATDFYAGVFNVAPEDVKIIKVNESLSKAIIKVAAGYALGKVAGKMLSNVVTNIIKL